MFSAKSGLNFYQNMKKKKDEIIDRSRRIDRLTDIQTDWAYIYKPYTRLRVMTLRDNFSDRFNLDSTLPGEQTTIIYTQKIIFFHNYK